MGKRIISCVIAFCLILSGITFESREEIKAAVTVTESHLYSVCPAYLNNETANNREAIARNAISKALSQISAADEFCAAYVLGLQKGEKILLNSFLSTCGISESMYDQKVDDAVTLLMDKFLCRNKNASEEAKSISTKYNKYLKKAFDLYDATSREEYISALQEANDKLDADAARDIVDEIMKDSSLKEIKKYVGDGIELWYLAANFVELQEIELETVDELISICVSNTATCGTDLHEGLLRYREEITNNIGEYFANNWLKDKIIEKVYNSIKKAGTKDFLSLPSSEKLAASLMVEVVAWAYEQNHPSANQIIEALIFQNFVISSGNAVNAVWYNLRLADSENYNKDTLKKQYILAHDLYYTAIQCSLNTAKKCTQDQGWKDVCSKYENAFRNTWTYSEYISLCLKDAQDDVNNGILVISTSNSTTTASGGKQSTNDNYLESIQAKFNEVKAHYPVESTWNGNWAGAIQCFGFARMVFSKLYGCEMSYRYKASAKYEYDDLTNVVMKGQLTGSNVTVENLKTLMAQGQLGDIVQAAGSSASQHTMVFEACTDSGILVYDCNSHLSGHNDADCTIHEWTIPWSSLVSWYGSGGISLYHAKNYESIYGDGSGLFYDDTVNFVIDENGILTKYNGWQSFVEIPDTVTSIGDSAFKGNKTMVSVTIPDSVKSIGNYAFENCTALAAAVIPDSVENIGDYAFSGCSSMESIKFPSNIKFTNIPKYCCNGDTSLSTIDIPDNITQIFEGAFKNNESLRNIELPINILSIGDSSFAKCILIEKVCLPKSLQKIGSFAFGNCTSLKYVYIPKSLKNAYINMDYYHYTGPFAGCNLLESVEFEIGITSIPKYLFDGCNGIKELKIPDTVTTIESCAFYGCENMTDVIFSNSLTQIGSGAFQNCIELSNVILPNSVTTIYNGAFYNCSKLSQVVLSNNLEYLYSNAFGECSSLENINIPKSLDRASISYDYYHYTGPFANCNNLKNVSFENGITKICCYLFDGCTGIENIIIPNTVKSIEYSAFYGCENLKDIVIGNGVTKIENSVFYGCINLEEIMVPDNVNSIGTYAFSKCNNLKSVELSNNINQITSGMFSGCKCLEEINLPEKIEEIGANAFYECELLSAIQIPNNVLKIQGGAFEKCTGLLQIEIPNSVIGVGDGIFRDCSSLKQITLGIGLKSIPRQAFYNCNSIESIQIPNKVESIGEEAFVNNTSLISIFIPRKTTSIASNAFSYKDRLTIYAPTTSYAQTYASDKGINFVAQDVPATSIVLNESSLILNKYNSAQLEATIAPANFTDEVVWSSSDTNVATVDQTGYVYAKQGGVTTITATAGNVSASCVVTVDQKISSIYFDDYSVSINIGEQKQLSVQIYPYDATNKDIEYKSLNENIATVNSNGVVTGIAEGTAEIKAIAKDGSEKWDSCYVYVSSSYSDDDNYEDNDHDDNYDDNMNNDNSNSGNESNNDNSSNNTSNTDSSNNSEGSSIIRLEDCIAELSTTVFTYDGTEKCPVVTIKNGSTLLVQNIDYTVQYTNNINVGTATVIVVGKGRYTGTVLLNYSIVASTSDANSSTNVPKKGTKLVDPKYKLVYKITNSNKVKPKVEFIGTNNKKAKNISVSNTVKINGITYIVESVGAGALKNNKTVTSITIGNNVTKIKNDAFRGCTKLSKITIGKNVISLGNNVFYGCKKLSKIKINSTKMTAKTLSSKAFAGINKNTIIDVPNSKIKSYKTLFAKKGLPKNVKIK